MMPLNCCGNMSVVQVSDQLHNTTTSVIVNVLDDNDNAPVFTQSSYEVDFQSYYWQMSIKSSTWSELHPVESSVMHLYEKWGPE